MASIRANIGPALTAMAVWSLAISQGYPGWLFGVGVLLSGAALAVNGAVMPSRGVLLAAGAIGGSVVAAAVLNTYLSPERALWAYWYAVVLMPCGALLFTRHSRATWDAILIGGLVAVAAITVDVLGDWGRRPLGLLGNPNPTAGVFVLLMAYAITHGRKVAAIPLAFGVLLTGSRWAAVCMVVLVLALLVTRRLAWEEFVPGFVIVAALFVAFGTHIMSAFRLMGDVNVVGQVTRAVEYRMSTPAVVVDRAWWDVAWITPRGPMEWHGGHNAPIRYAYTYGITAAAGWCALLVLTARRNPWMAGTAGLLSILDFYFTQPVGLPLWWVLVATRVEAVMHATQGTPVQARIVGQAGGVRHDAV